MSRCPGCGSQIPDNDRFCGMCGSSIGTASGTSNNQLSIPSDHFIGMTLINQFVIEKRISVGGMGTVYLADQPSMDRKVVIKILHSHLGLDPSWVSRFHREAQVACKMTHPNSITLYNFGQTEDGSAFIAMEYVEGLPLSSVIENEQFLDPDIAADITIQMCGALEEAHQLGIIHRDLKPNNILITKRGGKEHFAKVLDFGIAKIQGTDFGDSDLTAAGTVLGTPAYMSSEQFCGNDLDGRSDLYSLGVIMYEMLTGRRPYNASTPIGFLLLQNESLPPAFKYANPKSCVPEAMEKVVFRCLNRDRELRPSSGGELSELIQDAMGPEWITRIRAAGRSRTPTSSPQLASHSKSQTAMPAISGGNQDSQTQHPSYEPMTQPIGSGTHNDSIERNASHPVPDSWKNEQAEAQQSYDECLKKQTDRLTSYKGDCSQYAPKQDFQQANESQDQEKGKIDTGEQQARKVTPGFGIVRHPTKGTKSKFNIVKNAIDQGQFSEAFELLAVMLEKNPNDENLKNMMARCKEGQQDNYISRLQGSLDGVPVLAVDKGQVASLNLDNRAGFLLSQIDGSLSYEHLLDLSGMPILDTLEILVHLNDKGIISTS